MRLLLLITCVAAALILPAAAAPAMPVDNGPASHQRSARVAAPAVRTVTINHTSDDTLPLVLAGTALLVALGSAGFSAMRVRSRGGIERDAPLAGAPV